MYWAAGSASVKLVAADDIERYMRHLAGVVYYHLHPVRDAQDLSRWSSHSLHVEACVALHVMGFSDVDIQWILWWRSQAFRAYLRNIAILKKKITKSLTACFQGCLSTTRKPYRPLLAIY
jgi:hypothetical protein